MATAPPLDTDPGRPGWPTTPQWARAFVPFGLGLVAALWAAELTPNLRLYRAIYTIWVATLLAIPALALFPHRGRRLGWYNAWRLFWTFSFLAYAVHLAYAWYGVFGGQLALARSHPGLYHVRDHPTVLDLVLVHQGAFVAYSNLGVTALWALDVLLAWLRPGRRRGPLGAALTIERIVAWLWVAGSFVVATIYFPKHAISVALGWILVASAVVSLLARIAAEIAPKPRLTAVPGPDPRGG